MRTPLPLLRPVLAAAAAGVLLAVGAAIAVTSPAAANVPNGDRTENRPNLQGSGRQIWKVSPNPPTLNLIAVGSRYIAGSCLDSWFDWTRQDIGNDHYDARVVRTCRGRFTDTLFFTEPMTIGLRGMQKAAACFSGYNSSLTPNECTNAPDATSATNGQVQPSLPNFCTAAKVRTPAGALVTYPGGSSQSCTS